jgi:twitching motility protein PilT
MAQEIMIVNGAISNLIREQKTAQIYSMLQTGVNAGMQTLDMALQDLYKARLIDAGDALAKSQYPEALAKSIGVNYRT